MNRSPHLHLAKKYWSYLIDPGDVAIDATCGNGHDTLFLAQLPLSALFAFDIQPRAIEQTKKLLKMHLLKTQVFLHCASHAVFPSDLSPRLIVYNLGYLPGGDKSLTTQTTTTLESISSALSILSANGAISITCYPGHEEGAKEEQALIQLAKSFSPSQWDVRLHQWTQKPRHPSLLWIARLNDAKKPPSFS